MKILSGKNILIVSPESWGKSLLSKHHYALALAHEGNQVYFLNPPSDSGPLVNKPVEGVSLTVLNYQPGVRGLRHMPKFLRKTIAHWNLRKIESIIQDKIDVIWSFDPSRFIASQSSLYIYHVTDFVDESIFNLAVEPANLVLSVSPALIPSSFNTATNIGHGTVGVHEAKAIKLPGANKLKALYSGNLLIPYINQKLILELVGENPTVDFIFCGSIAKSNLNPHPPANGEEWIKTLNEAPNVYLTGELNKDELHSHMVSADILLCAYDHKQFPERIVNSHKLLEYLSSGRTIISSSIPGYPDDLIHFCDDDETFKMKFREIQGSLVEQNGVEITKKRKSFADQFTYQKQVERIDDLLSK